jgi:integrase/recombinase XerC
MESPQTLTREEADAILAHLATFSHRKYNSLNRVRDHALAVFMLEAGLRVGELVQLRLFDVLFNGQPVRTLFLRAETTKLHAARHVPVSQMLTQEITTLAQKVWCEHADQTASYCFYRSDPSTHLTTRSVEAIIRAASIAAIGRPIHPHMLRHTFATNMMRVTSARIVQELLGHASIRSTQVYTHPNGDDLAAAIAAKDAQERRTGE